MRTRIFRSALSLLALTAIAATVFADDDSAPRSDARCNSGFAGQFPCREIDLLSFLSLSELDGLLETGATFINDIWGWTDPKTKRDYVLLGMREGLAIVDVSKPKRPVVMGVLPTHSALGRDTLHRDVKVYADHAYVVSEHDGHGMQVLNLTQLRNTDISAGPVTFAETAYYNGTDLNPVGGAHNIAINEFTGFAYIVAGDSCSGGLHMIDITKPSDPTFAGCFSDHGLSHDTQCVTYHGEDSDYIGHEICFGSNAYRPSRDVPRLNTLSIADVTDKDHPVGIANAEYLGDGYSHQGWLTPDHSYFLHGDEFDELIFPHGTRTRIWDVRDLDNPVVIGMFDNTTASIDHNIYTEGKFAYATNYTSGLRVYDLQDVASGMLREVAYFDVYPEDDFATFAGAWSNYPYFRQKRVVAVSTFSFGGSFPGLFLLKTRLDDDSDGDSDSDSDSD